MMTRLLNTSMYLNRTGEQVAQPSVTTREVALANLRYCWNDIRQAKIFQLVNVWRMWNEVGNRQGNECWDLMPPYCAFS